MNDDAHREGALCARSPAHVVALLAAARIGAIRVDPNASFREAETAHVAGDSLPRKLLARTTIDGRDYSAKIAVMRSTDRPGRRVFTLDASSQATFDVALAKFSGFEVTKSAVRFAAARFLPDSLDFRVDRAAEASRPTR